MNVSGKRKAIFRILSLGSLVFIFLAMEAKAAPLEQEIEIEALELTNPSGKANIREGNIEIGGTLNYSSYGNGYVAGMSNRFEYFVFDRLSFGASTDLYFNEDGHSIGIGPSLTYYFWESGSWAAYFGQRISWIEASYDYGNEFGSYYKSGFSGESRLGAKYFIIPEVAVGLEYSYEYSLGDGQQIWDSHNLLNVSFSIHF